MKTILITGANRGIGKEIAQEMLQLGWRVIATARNAEKLNAAFHSNPNLICKTLDVSNESSITNLADELKKDKLTIDVLVNNAGIGVGNKAATAADMKEVREIFDVNFFGAWQVTLALLPFLKHADDAAIINMSSGMGAWDDLQGGYAGYRLSKTALNALTVLLANELRGQAIKVHSMCPGWVKTDMGGPNAPRTVEKGAETAVYLATQKGLPTGRFWRDKRPVSW